MRRRAALAVLVLLVLCAAPASVAAQAHWDPGAVVLAYSAALNAHDLAGALTLFDENSSAGTNDGRHFEGQAGLTEFLLASGFGNPDARITTTNLVVVANRAIWTYTCSCAVGSTEVRIVMNDRQKISVFAIMAPPTKPLPMAHAAVLPWLIALGLLAAALAGGLGLWRGRAVALAPRASQGRLLAGLAQAHAARGYTPGGADSDRVELPAAAMTSFNSSEDSAGPWSLYRKQEAARPGSR
jgi:SnoaL-like domain